MRRKIYTRARIGDQLHLHAENPTTACGFAGKNRLFVSGVFFGGPVAAIARAEIAARSVAAGSGRTPVRRRITRGRQRNIAVGFIASNGGTWG
jgi:hypothetical protein